MEVFDNQNWLRSLTAERSVAPAEQNKQKRLLEPLLGPSLLTTDGPEWQRLRRIASPAFRPATIAGFVPHFVAATERMSEEWLRRPVGENRNR